MGRSSPGRANGLRLSDAGMVFRTVRKADSARWSRWLARRTGQAPLLLLQRRDFLKHLLCPSPFPVSKEFLAVECGPLDYESEGARR